MVSNISKQKHLRIIRSTFFEQKINDAALAGFCQLIKYLDSSLPKRNIEVLQHKTTGEIIIQTDIIVVFRCEERAKYKKIKPFKFRIHIISAFILLVLI